MQCYFFGLSDVFNVLDLICRLGGIAAEDGQCGTMREGAALKIALL
jgi:hypothetical protein